MTDSELAHDCEARGINVRVLTLVVPTEPGESGLLLVQRNAGNSYARRRSQGIEELYGGPMSRLPPKIGPGLTLYMIRRNQGGTTMQLEQRDRFRMMRISAIPKGDPERCVDEDHAVKLLVDDVVDCFVRLVVVSASHREQGILIQRRQLAYSRSNELTNERCLGSALLPRHSREAVVEILLEHDL